ncbi:MAG: citrate lyase subunit alpha [Bacilli bacterium]|nr:citrate lyase subunit alpha [Bacilli bacterium]
MIKNSLNRFIPDGFRPFQGSFDYLNHPIQMIPEVLSTRHEKMMESIASVFDAIPICDGMTLSFHHHLRNGDYVFNMVLDEIKKRQLKNMILAPSAIFPNNERLCELIEAENVVEIITNYLNGPVSRTINEGKLREYLIMETHGGRARSIETGELPIDVCFAAAPYVDLEGNANGMEGPSACGSLGYILPDIKYAKVKVLITDTIVKQVTRSEIEGKYVDYIVKVPQIGDQAGIVSGTTKITKDPIGLKIARDTALLLSETGYLINGFSMQTGAGGISLAVTDEVRKIMEHKHIMASFASGGITSYFVELLEKKMIERLYDVQCFDLEAVRSYRENANHIGMSSSQYANPYNPEVIVDHLDFVILGATEIDINFNVNVTTSSTGMIMGGSGGHADAAHGARLTIITTNLLKSRLPIIKEQVTTITTPGEDVDVLVTEWGIAINPKRQDLIEQLKNSPLKIVPIEELLQLAHQMAGVPSVLHHKEKIIGVVKYRDGSIIDTLYQW